MKRVVIVTGGNRGIGLAIAKVLCNDQASIVIMSRQAASEDGSLEKVCAAKQATLTFVRTNMADVDSLTQLFAAQVVPLVNAAQPTQLLFVQNAGVAYTQVYGAQTDAQIKETMLVNSVAPLLLTEAFVRAFGDAAFDKRILMISSGAGRTVYAGWASYGASKAALDHMTRILVEEQQGAAHPIRACSYGPGVVETSMQAAVRNTESDLPIVARLREMKAAGKTMDPARSAQIATDYLLSAEFGSKATEDAYNLIK
jgi:benzil reductase ((S)-benzoin forming)